MPPLCANPPDRERITVSSHDAVEEVSMRADVETELSALHRVRLVENLRCACPVVVACDSALRAYRHEPDGSGRKPGGAAAP